MNNLIIDEGFKEFKINGDENRIVRFNPADFSILERINEVYKRLENAPILKENIRIKNDGSALESLSECAETVKKANDYIKECIDYLFASKVSDVVFGNQSPLSSVKGIPFYERFLSAVIPVIKNEIEKENESSRKRIDKYTKAVEK